MNHPADWNEAAGFAVGDLARREDLEAAGYLVMVAPAEPHAHLDKALTADRVHNPEGDLGGAIRAWLEHRSTIDQADFVERASRALRMGLASGVTAVRTHVDISSDAGLAAVHALLEVKKSFADLVDLQIVGLVSLPTTGDAGRENRQALLDALDLGIDVVGGCPHLDSDSAACTRWLLEIASEHRVPLDLHTDENLRLDSLDLELLAELVVERGFTHGVVASHCVSLGIQPPDVQRRVATKVAEAGISVIALPQTNLFLQARGDRVGPPRALTAVASLDEAGVNVAAGADNLQDPFCLMGRADPLETASLMVMTAHLTPDEAYDAVSRRARAAMGLTPTNDLLAVRAQTLREAIASAPAERIVVRDGRVVSNCCVTHAAVSESETA